MNPREIFEDGYSEGFSKALFEATKGYGENIERDIEGAWNLSRAKKEADRIAASLSLLDSPLPGTVVRGEGFEWEYQRFESGLPYWDADEAGLMDADDFIPILAQAVKGGAQVVLPPASLSKGETDA